MGEKQPFEIVYEEQFSYVYNYVYMMMMNRETAEDIVSETFLKAYRHYDQYDSEKSSVKTWLCRIARNACVDHIRSAAGKKIIPFEEAEEPSYEEESKLLQDDANKRAFAVLEGLSRSERELLAYRYQLGYSNEEVAKKIGSTPKAVSERYRRLLAKCKKVLEKKGIKKEDLL